MKHEDLILDKETREKLLTMYSEMPTLYKMHEPMDVKKKYGWFRFW